jgi:glycosyltransferase involved in cell wall biosynthesis
MTIASTLLCEIRVPTFRRPQLLRRALDSIVNQTCSGWRCVVFDDCPHGSAEAIISEMEDPRIEYVPNQNPLGAIGNIDRAFQSKPLRGGKYAFVLEDDNYLLPNHIENSINVLERNQVRVAFCNQFCERVVVPGEPGQITLGRTLDWMYREGLFEPKDLFPTLLFSHGFSNGAAFWRTDCLSDFQIGGATNHPGIQESLRLLQVRDPVYVSLEPTSVWRSNDPRESYVNTEPSARDLWDSIRSRLDSALLAKEKLDYRYAVVKAIGIDGILGYVKGRDSHVAELERSLLLCGYNLRLSDRRRRDRLRLLLKGWVARFLIPSQLNLQICKDIVPDPHLLFDNKLN